MKHRLLRPLLAAALAIGFILGQVTWALAGTTGGLSGTVTDEKGAPTAGASVSIASPSQQASTTTDAHGRFVFLNLAPDTYTVAVSKEGYDRGVLTGVTVFADNTFSSDVHLTHLQEIGHTTTDVAGGIVKSGLTSDVYSVNEATAAKVAALGGGVNMNQATRQWRRNPASWSGTAEWAGDKPCSSTVPVTRKSDMSTTASQSIARSTTTMRTR